VRKDQEFKKAAPKNCEGSSGRLHWAILVLGQVNMGPFYSGRKEKLGEIVHRELYLFEPKTPVKKAPLSGKVEQITKPKSPPGRNGISR